MASLERLKEDIADIISRPNAVRIEEIERVIAHQGKVREGFQEGDGRRRLIRGAWIMNVEEYLSLPYTHVLRQDEESDWIASIEELDGCTTHGATQEEALGRLKDMQRAWIEDSLETGQPVPTPSHEEEAWSGRWVQRVPRSLHRLISRVAKLERVSLNQWVSVVLAREVGHSLATHETKTEDLWGRVEAFAEGVDIKMARIPADVALWMPDIDIVWSDKDDKALTHRTRR